MDDKKHIPGRHRGPDKKPRKAPNLTDEQREQKRNNPALFKAGHSAPAVYTPEVYESMIAAYAADFIPYFFPGRTDAEAAAELEDPQTFRGLLVYIYQHVFMPAPGGWGSNIDYNDTGLLCFLFDQYLLLCARYKQIPTVDNYC